MASQEKPSWRWLLVLAIVFVGVFCTTRYFVANDVVAGDSMLPTLHAGQRLLSLKQKTPRRFDIIVLDAPDQPGNLFIKRVIGLPGDRVQCKNGTLYLNGKRQAEPYLQTPFAKKALAAFTKQHQGAHFTADFSLQTLKATHTTTVPAGEYFVMGDNRLVSHDGRAFGFVTKAQVESVVALRYWPLNALHHF